MEKVGRNDPCPCGSGKKYKTCHGASNVIMMDPSRYNKELIQLQSDLIKYAWNGFESELDDMAQVVLQDYGIEDEELVELYKAAFMAYAIFYEPVLSGKTIYELFFMRYKHQIKLEQVRKCFAKWGETVPSIYDVVHVAEDRVLLVDLRTEEEFYISSDVVEDFEVGTTLLGLLIPYVREHDFFLTMVGFNDLDTEILEQLWSYSDDDMMEDYPFILAELLEHTASEPEVELEWDDPQYERVAEVLVENMDEKDAPKHLVMFGLMIWHLYTKRAHPTVQKAGSYAAAVEYVLQKEIIGEAFQSQKDLGEEYGISATTVSKNARRIINSLGYELELITAGILSSAEENDEEEEIIPHIENLEIVSEKMMADLKRAIEGQSFDSEEEFHQFMEKYNENQEMFLSTPSHPRDIAQDLLYEAYEAKGAKRKQLIEKALKTFPNSPDAYMLMAEDAKTLNEKYQFYYKAVVAGEKDLGKVFFEENKGHFWMISETRPYMRAKAELANTLYLLGDIEGAIKTLEEMLELNPMDNQGVRYILLSFYLENRQFDDAQALLKQFEGDATASFQFNEALLYYFKDGLTTKTKYLLKKAHEANPYVKDFLTAEKRLPSVPPEYVGFGDENEAIAYLHESINLWKDAFPLIKELAQLR